MIENYKKNKSKIAELYKQIDKIPQTQGIYIIEVPEKFNVGFLFETTGPKTYKGKNLIYDKAELEIKFNAGDKKILYIGKTTCTKGLKNRLGNYLKYGYGKDVPHRGGRAVWQIKNWENLTVYYCECENANELEINLLSEYKTKFGVYPLANWKK